MIGILVGVSAACVLCLIALLVFLKFGKSNLNGLTVGESGNQDVYTGYTPNNSLTEEEVVERFKAQWENTYVDENGSTIVKNEFTSTELTREDIEAIDGFAKLIDDTVQKNTPRTARIDDNLYAIVPGRGKVDCQVVQTLDMAVEVRYKVTPPEDSALTTSDVVVTRIDFIGDELPIYFTNIDQKIVDHNAENFLYPVYKSGVGIFPLLDLPQEMIRKYSSQLVDNEQFSNESDGIYVVDIVDGEIGVWQSVDRYLICGKLKEDVGGTAKCIIGNTKFNVNLKDSTEFNSAVEYNMIISSNRGMASVEILK